MNVFMAIRLIDDLDDFRNAQLFNDFNKLLLEMNLIVARLDFKLRVLRLSEGKI